MEFDQLRQLDAIARTGSFSAAAAELRTSQPTVSRSMRALESELGCELFTRSRNRAELNDAGRLAVDHARAVLAEERLMRDAFAELTRQDRTLAVASVAPAPVWKLTEIATQAAPGTILVPETLEDEREVERRLLDRSADLVITCRPIGLPNVACTPLMVENLFVLVPPGDDLAGRRSVGADDLAGRTFLMSAAAGFWKDIARRLFPEASFIEQGDMTVLSRLAKTSDLPTFVTDASEFQHYDEGRVRLPIRDAEAHATFYLVALLDAPQAVRRIMAAVPQE